jgi:molecular chaperone GrpE (heat shock protein)
LAKSINSVGPKIMTEPLPQILDELDAAIQAAKEAKAESDRLALKYAQDVGDAAAAAIKAEIDKLLPRITDAQATAGKALQVANDAKKAADLNSGSIKGLARTIEDLSGLLGKTRKQLYRFAGAVVNTHHLSSHHIATECSDMVTLECDTAQVADDTAKEP